VTGRVSVAYTMAALYSEVIKLDKKLTNLCTNRRSLDDPDVEAARSLLCEKSAALLLTDYTYATVCPSLPPQPSTLCLLHAESLLSHGTGGCSLPRPSLSTLRWN
jgi:hypothetical protein